MQEQHYLPVNWTDGMKINKSHFIAQDNAFRQQLAQNTSSQLHEYNYGLLPSLYHNNDEVKIFVSMDNQQQVQIRIQECRAVTPGGYFLQVEEDTALNGNNLAAPVLNLSVPFRQLQGRADSFFVVISVHPYHRVPYGSIDPAELPARLPFTVPYLAIALIPAVNANKNVLGLAHLPVGKIKIDEQKVFLDDKYLPPCSSVSSHPYLRGVHAGLEQFYGKLENYALQIIQKILQKKQINDMAGIVQKLCENICLLTASHLAEIKTLSLQQPPAHLFNKVNSLARLFKNTLDFYIGSGREEFINYCTEWCGIEQGELEGVMTSLANHQYSHLDLNSSIEKVLQFTRVVSTLFDNLVRLEYIGKRKEAGIFVKANIIHAEPQQPEKKRGSFLVD